MTLEFLFQAWDRHKKTLTYDIGILVPGLGQAQKCSEIKLIN